MKTKSASWQEHFGLTICPASEITKVIPADAQGVAVIYEALSHSKTVFLVLESRAGSLRDLCTKRMSTANLPPISSLTVAFKGETHADASPEQMHTLCREQVYLGAELRRELRPAMR